MAFFNGNPLASRATARYGLRMFIRLLLCLSLPLLGLTGCNSLTKKKETADAADQKKKPEKLKAPTIKDQSGDPNFLAFVGRLRIAVAQKDGRELAQMMAPGFGYRWDEPPPGETPFDYWNNTNAWPELERLLNGRFVPHEEYMVAPVKFATDPTYRDYRLGIRQLNGSWKLVYFITGEDVLQ